MCTVLFDYSDIHILTSRLSLSVYTVVSKYRPHIHTVPHPAPTFDRHHIHASTLASQTSCHGVTTCLLYVFPTPFIIHHLYHASPAKLSFQSCLAHPDKNPHFALFRPRIFRCLSLSLAQRNRIFGFTHEPGPAPSPATGFRPSGLPTPVSPGVPTGASNLGVRILPPLLPR